MPEQKERIFDSFSQADSSTTRQYGGTGLGLAISRRLVQLMGDELSVKSEPGLGASFQFTVQLQIPVNQEVELSEDQQKLQETKSDTCLFDHKILLAEDNPTNQIVAEGMLALLGCTVDVVENGIQAVEAVKKNRYDLVFMDCQMPELEGYSATKEIRTFEEHKGESRIPIIALTAHVMSGDKERCLTSGMDDYLGKPMDQNQLLNI